MLHFLVLSLLLHLLPFSSCSSPENSWCSEGRQRLDSVAFLDCQQQGLSKLHKMGIWITRSLDPNWQVGNHKLTANGSEQYLPKQKPSDGLSVCEYMDLLNSTCLPLYSNCTLSRQELWTTWVRQASKLSLFFFFASK